MPLPWGLLQLKRLLALPTNFWVIGCIKAALAWIFVSNNLTPIRWLEMLGDLHIGLLVAPSPASAELPTAKYWWKEANTMLLGLVWFTHRLPVSRANTMCLPRK